MSTQLPFALPSEIIPLKAEISEKRGHSWQALLQAGYRLFLRALTPQDTPQDTLQVDPLLRVVQGSICRQAPQQEPALQADGSGLGEVPEPGPERKPAP